MPFYEILDTGIDFGTNYLTERVAYFLGGILAADECAGVALPKYWVAPFRYNYSFASKAEIEQHFELVKSMSRPMRGATLMADAIRRSILDSGKFRLAGFGTFFENISLYNLEDLFDPLREALDNSSNSVNRAFMVGVLDGRGSFDIVKKQDAPNYLSLRYISLDSPKDSIGYFLKDYFESRGFACNFNTARDRLEGGKPRNHQLRIKDPYRFIAEIGFVSPKKLNLIRNSYNVIKPNYTEFDDSTILRGLTTIRG